MDCCPVALYENLCCDLANVPGYDPYSESGAWPGMTPPQFAASALQASLLKKYKAGKAATADERALEKFLDVNQRCGAWELKLKTETEEVLYGEFKRAIHDFWFREGMALVYHIDEIFNVGRLGPGASLGASGNDFYSKLFSSRLTSTSRYLCDSYRQWVKQLPTWADAEQSRSDTYGEPVLIDGSRISFVEKYTDISRVIFVESILGMFSQLGFGEILLKRLKEVFAISLDSQQSINRELAHKASEDGGLATIDLTSASDSISLKMLKEVLPPDFFGWLRLLRSDKAQVPDGDVELNMVSTMGNGFTFPLETVLFSCVVSAAMRVHDLPMIRNGQRRRIPSRTANFGVYGDDIICPTEVVGKVLTLLRILGFEVNAEKSFVEGRFYESCGGDYYMGHHARGVYIKSLKSQQDRYVAINSLFEWSRRTGINVPNAIDYLMSSVQKRFVPMHENSDAGIKVPLQLVRSNTQRKAKGINGIMYRRYMPRTVSVKFDPETEKVLVPKRGKKRVYNPSGLLLALLHGSLQGYRGNIRMGEVNIRLDVTLYSTKWGVTSNWDYLPPSGTFQVPYQASLLRAAYSNFLEL